MISTFISFTSSPVTLLWSFYMDFAGEVVLLLVSVDRYES